MRDSGDPVSLQIMACVCKDFHSLVTEHRKMALYISYINQRVLALPDGLDCVIPIHIRVKDIYKCTGLNSGLSISIRNHLRNAHELYDKNHYLVLRPIEAGGRLDWFEILRIYYRRIV